MAEWFDDFRGLTAGTAPADLTVEFADGAMPLTVTSGNVLSGSDRKVQIDGSNNDSFTRCGIAYKKGTIAVSGRTAVRILAEYDAGNFVGGLLAGGGSTVATRTGYAQILRDNDHRIFRYISGSSSTLASGSALSVDPLLVNLELILDAASGDIEARYWLLGDPRPETAQLETNDTSLTSGWCGISILPSNVDNTLWLHSIAVGTNGDPAPTGPASTGTTGTADHQASTATHSATGSASSTITGTADHQAATATQAATGTREVTATGAHQAQPVTHSASGSVGSAITGTASHQASPATHSATAEREITGTSNSQAARATHSATGLRVVTGDAVHQAGAATHSAQGAAGNAFVGSGDHQAQTSTHAATGTRKVTGTSASQAQTATHNATAVREIIGNGTQAANDATHSSTGTISRTITGTASHQAQRATHQASSRPVLLRPIKNTSLVEVTPDYSTVDISPTYTIAVQ